MDVGVNVLLSLININFVFFLVVIYCTSLN